jgi:hypothetical protein
VVHAVTEDTPATPSDTRPLPDELRRAAFCTLRASAFDEVGIMALRADPQGLTDALLALGIGLPFWVAGFASSDACQALLDQPVRLVSSALSFYLVGSLSPLAWAGAAAILLGRPERFWRCGAGLLWWGAASLLFSSPAAMLGAWGVLADPIQEGVDLAFALWCTVVSAWIVGRTLGVPTLLAGLIVLLDMLASDVLALYLFES